MPSPRRTTWVFLLLAILVSHAALALHFNTHVAAEQQGCEICTHYSNFGHAVPPVVVTALVAATDVPALLAPAAPAAITEGSPYHQRAPPPAA